MGLFRLIFYAVIIWLIARVVQRFLPQEDRKNQVHGKPQNNDSLDLENADIEDAEFEEIDE